MRLKLDENLPVELAWELARLGHDVDTVSQESLTGEADETVWAATQAVKRCLITQDLDFSDIRKFAPGMHHGIILVRLSDPSRSKLLSRIRHAFATEAVEAWVGSFVIVTDLKVRLRTKSPDFRSE